MNAHTVLWVNIIGAVIAAACAIFVVVVEAGWLG